MSSVIFSKPTDLAESAPRLHGNMVFEIWAHRFVYGVSYDFLVIFHDMFPLGVLGVKNSQKCNKQLMRKLASIEVGSADEREPK